MPHDGGLSCSGAEEAAAGASKIWPLGAMQHGSVRLWPSHPIKASKNLAPIQSKESSVARYENYFFMIRQPGE